MKKNTLRTHVCSVLFATSIAFAQQPLVINDGNANLSTLVNYSVGYRFTVGANDILATYVGIWDNGLNGLTQAHAVGIWDSATGTLLASGTVPSGTAGTLDGEFRYAPLSNSLVLSSGQTYTLGALYTTGNGDQSHQLVNGFDPLAPTFSSDVTNVLGYYRSTSTLAEPNTFVNRAPNAGYVGPSIQYELAPSHLTPSLNWQERSDWINVKTDVTPAAVGDGVTDDTAAIQAALNTPGKGRTIYFPPGTYKVTNTLTLSGGNIHFAITLIGHGRDTVLEWHGANGGNFISVNGNPYSRYVGLTLDGRGSAANGFYHYNTMKFETNIRYQHMGFYNFINAGMTAVYGDSYATAETSFENCIFVQCGRGVSMSTWNDYNYTLAGCDFIACGHGIYGYRGNFYARECYFEGSTIADIYHAPEHGSSVRRCKSVGSVQFITGNSSVSPMLIEDSYITGWTGSNGAMTAGNAPCLVFNSRFVDPPDTNAPIRIGGGGPAQRAFICNNAAPQSSALITMQLGTPYTIPAGTVPPQVGSVDGANITTFVDQSVSVPSVVFDAKVDFGAVGNGTTDDTAAIQNCIDAARTASGGAIAYIPLGTYKITSTLTASGSDYRIGGSGYFSMLRWNGAAGGTMLAIADPNNVTLEHISIGHVEGAGPLNNSIDVEQTSTGATSRMNYDGLYVWGKYQSQPENKGLRLNGLGSNCTVVMQYVQGNIRLLNSANATVLGNITYEGGIVVDHTSSTREGFLGFMTRLSTFNVYALTVRNNNSIVMSDWYAEQSTNGTWLEGGAGDPEGRVTISCPKVDYTSTNPQVMTINNYQGKVFFGPTQFYVNPAVQTMSQSGSRPVDIVVMGGLFYGCSLADIGGTFRFIGNLNTGGGTTPADNYTPQTLSDISLAVDDLQYLGTLDLLLNFPHIFF